MRLSSDKSDPQYHHKQIFDVYLDGKISKFVTEADDLAGYIISYDLDSAGIIVAGDGTLAESKKIGEVKIIPRFVVTNG